MTSLIDKLVNIGAPRELYEEACGSIMSESVKIIILGQDPFVDETKRTGMAFSYPEGQRPSDSNLSIIIAALKGKDSHDSVDVDRIVDGYLGSWSDQDVLLINAIPVLGEEAKWVEMTRNILYHINKWSPDAICIFLGSKAAKYSGYFKNELFWAHPSKRSIINNDPSDPRHWNHCTCFQDANDMLIANRMFPIIWSSVLGRRTLYIFTDGGATKNGKANCRATWAFVIKDPHNKIIMSRAKEFTEGATNNVAELMAINRALDWVSASPEIYDKFTIVSDSRYSIDSITIWYASWVKKGLLGEKSNTELIGKIVNKLKTLRKTKTIEFVHVRSHQKKPSGGRELFLWQGNSDVDKLCGY